ncbi:MAG: phosphatase PAP2 family protein [Firmicutes bacterium]|nr:phosphatase PAP2 family protein [Bacillota bacterium]
MKNRKWVIIGLIILFIVLTFLVKTNLIKEFDSYFYNLVTFKVNDSFTNIYKLITFLGSTEFIIFLCVFFLGLFIILKKKNTGLIISGVLVISTIVNNLLKIIIMRSRPEVLAFVEEHSYSFPSGHTMASVSMYGILLYLVLKSNMNNKLKIILSSILSMLPIFVALSRVYLGAHFMSDVIGAFIVSIALLLIETYYIDKKKWI